jgi:P-type E1-E2 ATPase
VSFRICAIFAVAGIRVHRQLGAFGKQPRFVWLLVDGQEIQVSLQKLNKGDIVVVNTGEVVPVDGIIVEGLTMIDQHALTGESTPAEKGIGDQVFASTVMVAGKILVSVERSGEATATAKIAQILNDTAGYKLAAQQRGEQLADKAVVPTLAVGALALGTMGLQGAAAVLNSDMGTGIRMAAPLAMLSTLALCSQRGVLVKDGRALDLLCEIDTVLFDKTGTLTRERPRSAGSLLPTAMGSRTYCVMPQQPNTGSITRSRAPSWIRRKSNGWMFRPSTPRNTRSAMASPSTSRVAESASAVAASWNWRASR